MFCKFHRENPKNLQRHTVRAIEKRRGSPNAYNPIYIKLINSARWKKLRAEKLTANPICEECEAKGLSTPATEVHHLTEVESVPTEKAMTLLMFEYDNLKSVCHPCHAEIHRLRFSHSKESVQTNNQRATERFKEKYL